MYETTQESGQGASDGAVVEDRLEGEEDTGEDRWRRGDVERENADAFHFRFVTLAVKISRLNSVIINNVCDGAACLPAGT